MTSNTRVLIAAVPKGPLGPEHFEIEEAAAPDCGEGQVLCRTVALTIGAGQRAGLQGSASYAGAPKAGVVMGGTGVARVEASAPPGSRQAIVVVARPAGRRFPCTRPRRCARFRPAPIPRCTSACSAPTASPPTSGCWTSGAAAGRRSSFLPRRGRSVTSSARSRSARCRVVGVAGSAAKCGMLVDELGFDTAINYKDRDFRDAFKAATPDRIDVYFDNTGGDILGSALFRMNTHGRIVCCGAVSQYDTATRPAARAAFPVCS